MTEEKFEECVGMMNRGQKEGLRLIYEEYASYIYGIVRQILPSKEDAEDVTSDFFIKLWEKSESYKPGSGHKGYLATIARNAAVDLIRKRRREELTDFEAERDEDGERNVASSIADEKTPSPEEAVVGELSMEQALATLKESERQIIHLKIMADMTFKEIAELLGEPQGTIAWRYREAINKLRRCGYEEA